MDSHHDLGKDDAAGPCAHLWISTRGGGFALLDHFDLAFAVCYSDIRCQCDAPKTKTIGYCWGIVYITKHIAHACIRSIAKHRRIWVFDGSSGSAVTRLWCGDRCSKCRAQQGSSQKDSVKEAMSTQLARKG